MYKGRLTQNNVHLEEHEYKTVKFLLEQGYDIELIPPSRIKNLRMPDLMLMGLPWEMKAPLGDSKHTIKNIVQNASQQSANIIIVALFRIIKTPTENNNHFKIRGNA